MKHVWSTFQNMKHVWSTFQNGKPIDFLKLEPIVRMIWGALFFLGRVCILVLLGSLVAKNIINASFYPN